MGVAIPPLFEQLDNHTGMTDNCSCGLSLGGYLDQIEAQKASIWPRGALYSRP